MNNDNKPMKPGRFVTVSTSSTTFHEGDRVCIISAIDVHGNLWHKQYDSTSMKYKNIGETPWVLDVGNIIEPEPKPDPEPIGDTLVIQKRGWVDKLFGI